MLLLRRIKRHGISVFELVIAGAILSVILSTGYTSLSHSMKTQYAQKGAESIGYAIKNAKYLARSEGVETSFTFTRGSGSYSVKADGKVITDKDYIGSYSGELPDKTTITEKTCSDFRFDVNGSLIDTTGATIYTDCKIKVGYSGGPEVTVLVRGKTGNVEYK